MQSKSILIVEDDEGIRSILKMCLELEGYLVFAAQNGREGLAMLSEIIPRPSLILLDMMMPIMNGFEFLAAREEEVTFACIPVVIVSAIPSVPQSLKIQGFVKKPIKFDKLMYFIRQYCG